MNNRIAEIQQRCEKRNTTNPIIFKNNLATVDVVRALMEEITSCNEDVTYLLAWLAERDKELKRLQKEVAALAIESIEREKTLAKLEAEVMQPWEAQRWIPVDERLPEQSGAYWVNLHQEDEDSEEVADFCVMAWYWPNKLLFAPQEVGWILLNEWHEFSDKMRQHITHWMQLPAAPEEGAGK